MRKMYALLLIGVMLCSGFGAAVFNTNIIEKNTTIQQHESTSVLFSSQPAITETDGFLEIEIDGATTHLIEPNKPDLPIHVKTFRLPWGSKNIQVTCTPNDISSMQLDKEIMPARVAPLSKMNELKTTYTKDESVYGSSEFYPTSWYSYDLGAGRDYNGEQVIFLKFMLYPVRYSPATSTLEYVASFDITVTYDAPSTPLRNTGDEYDLMVIAPAEFEAKLQPLVDHKISKGMRTMFKSVEDILTEYDGADPPEQVKYFIKEAYDTLGITYVLLVGGLKSHLRADDKDQQSYGSKAWWVPVRYLAIRNDDEVGCLCDLYFGDLYNATGAFSSWDSNGNNIYGEWSMGSRDKMDLYPEVYVGRLPCTTTREVDIVVKKIITYESTGPEEKPWYKTMISIGGKTFAYYQGKPDGEYLGDLALSYMDSIIDDPVRLYATNRDSGGLCPTPEDITSTIAQGAGFVDFEGHGNPIIWDTIWHDGTYPKDWIGGVNLYQFKKFTNGDKLPVVVVGGCHNGLYNVSILPSIRSGNNFINNLKENNHTVLYNLFKWILLPSTSYWTSGIPAPVCFSWGFVVKSKGGAIACTGDTGYGIGSGSNPLTLSAELEMNFFWEIGVNGTTNLGGAHSGSISKFLNEESIGQTEAFCITNWQVFGDPSLKFGGYSS